MPTGNNRRARADSVSSAVAAYQKAKVTFTWPSEISHLSALPDQRRADSIYQKILLARSPDDWRECDLPIAAQLATATVLADKLLSEVERDGFTIASPKNPAQRLRNPALDGLQMIGARQLSLQRMLGLSGPPADRKTIEKNSRQVANARNAIGGDDFWVENPDDPRDLLA